MNAKFLDIHAAADYIGPGAVEVPLYQTEIIDIVRRRGMFGQRIKQVPATGHPSRFFEETAIPTSAARPDSSIRATSCSGGEPHPRGAQRSAEGAGGADQLQPVRHRTGQAAEQFAYLQAKDLVDTVDGVMRTHDVALWNGNDTA